MFRKIVVAVDGSEKAEHALETACDIASKYKSELHIVHSPQLETTVIAAGGAAVHIPPDQKKIDAAGKQVMTDAVNKAMSFGCNPSKQVIGNGDPADEILKELDASDADLVVMGRRGLGPISSALLGSVSQKVSRYAECTCMTVC